MGVGERIRRRREELRLSQAEIARRVGTTPQAISLWELGERRIRAEFLERLARALECSPRDLLPDGGKDAGTVPLVGHVGAGAEIFPPDEDQELDRVPAPWREARELAAVVVRGGSMEPEFWDGDLIFYEPPNGMSDPEELVGRTVVCRTEDGRTFVKRLLRGSKPGLWTLESHAAPPMKDVRLVWVAPIRYIKRGGP